MLGCKKPNTVFPDHQTINMEVIKQLLCTQKHAATVCMYIVW